MSRPGRSVTVAVLCFCGCSRETPAPIPPWDGSLSKKIPEPVRVALEQASEFELLSLDPKHRDDDEPGEFLRRRVIGKTLIADGATREKLLAAIDFGQAAEGPTISCFDPRHAIRVRHAGKTYYLTICFECENVYGFIDEKPDMGLYFHTTAAPEPVFDEVLREAGVPLAAKGMLEDELERPSKSE